MDWKQQLQQVYKTMQHKAKHERPKDKFDLEANYKGRKGYNDTGVPITARAAKQKQKNRSMYAARAAAKYWAPGSQLRNINDQRKAAAEERWGKKEQPATVHEPMTNNIRPRYNANRYVPLPRARRTYYEITPADDSIEVTPSPHYEPIKFKNKVDEAIYRSRLKSKTTN